MVRPTNAGYTSMLNILLYDSTSLPDMAFFFHKLIKRETRIRAPFVVSIVFMFIFCLDIIGGVIFYINAKEL